MNRQSRSLTVLGLALVGLVLGLAACTQAPATPIPAPPTRAAAVVPSEPPTAPATQSAATALPAQPTAEPAPTVAVTPVAPSGPAPATDWERIKAAGKMVVGTSADYAPFAYYTPDFKIDGFDPALIRAIGKQLGVEVELKDFAFDGLAGALSLGQIDAAIAAISVTPKRAEQVAFTHPYYAGEGAVLARPDYSGLTIRVPENMAGMKVGVQNGSVYQTWMENVLVNPGLTPPEDVVPYADIRQAMDDLKAKKLDLVLLDYLPAQTYVNSGEAKMVGRGENAQSYAIAARFGSSLLPQLDAALDKLLADGTVGKLAEQYLDVKAGEVVNPPEPTATPVPPTAVPAPPTATPVPACTNGMAWVQDLNYDDKNHSAPPIVQPHQAFVKSWRVRNSGTCPWKPAFALVFVQGNVPDARMNGQPVLVGHEVPVNGTDDLSVSLTAPVAPGRYTAWWQMQDDQGVAFGERIWVDIVVPGPATPTPVPPPQPPPQPVPPPAIINFSVNPGQIQTGQCVGIDWEVQGSISWVRILVNNAVRWEALPTRGSVQDCPNTTGTYQYALESGGPGGTSRQERTVQVNQQPPPQPKPNIDYFRPNTDRVRPGQCVDLSWAISGGSPQYQRLERNGQQIMSDPNARRYSDCPSTVGVITYTLIAGNNAGESRASTQVQVLQ